MLLSAIYLQKGETAKAAALAEEANALSEEIHDTAARVQALGLMCSAFGRLHGPQHQKSRDGCKEEWLLATEETNVSLRAAAGLDYGVYLHEVGDADAAKPIADLVEAQLRVLEREGDPALALLRAQLVLLQQRLDWPNSDAVEGARRLEYAATELERESLIGTGNLQVVLLNALHEMALAAGEPETSWRVLEQALEIQERDYGPIHPSSTRLWTNFGYSKSHFGYYEQATERFGVALAHAKADLKNQAERVPVVLAHLCVVAGKGGMRTEALAWAKQSQAGVETGQWSESVNTGACLAVMASDASDQGDHERALELVRRAEATGTIQHRVFSQIKRAAGDLEGAREHLEAALRDWRRGKYNRVEYLADLAHLEFASRKFAKARTYLEQGAPLCDIPHGDGRPCVLIHAMRAEDSRRGGDLEAARRFAKLGRAELGKTKGLPFEWRGQVEAWLGPE